MKEAVAECRSPNHARRSRQAGAGPSRPGTSQDGRAEQPDVRQRPADLRARDSRVRRLVLLEPRLAFNRTVVLRYRIHLEHRHYAPATINLRLAAVRRIAYEAADSGLLSPELAAGIRRVKGVRRLVVRLGNWLTPEQGRRLLEHSTPSTPRALRDHAMLAMLIGCGLRRAELLALTLESVQHREEHWVIADLVGKGGHVRTVPIPGWVKDAVDTWTDAVDITHGPVFRAINKAGRVWGDDSEGALGRGPGSGRARWHREARTAPPPSHVCGLFTWRAAHWIRFDFCWAEDSFETTERYLGRRQRLRCAVNDRLGIEPDAA